MVYLHYAQAIGMERLSTLMDEIISLSISEGAISNMLARARQPLLAAAETIRATVLASPVVCSDETSARVSGKNWWEWVFIGSLAVLHVIRPSRGKAVVQALFGEIRPLVWVSDMLGSQRGHAVEWQVCLAHLPRDVTYAIECGDIAFSAAFKRLLLRAIAIGRRRDELKDITLKQYLAWLPGADINGAVTLQFRLQNATTLSPLTFMCPLKPILSPPFFAAVVVPSPWITETSRRSERLSVNTVPSKIASKQPSASHLRKARQTRVQWISWRPFASFSMDSSFHWHPKYSCFNM